MSGGRRALAGLCAALTLTLGSGAAAADTAVRPGRAVAFTISGGVSLGSYEAGLLYYALETARQNPGLLALRLATGASAGSVNALLSLLAHCGEPAPSPARSLFWQVWTPAGFRQLLVHEEVSRQGLFSRRWLDGVADRIEEVLRRGLPESCDAVLGVAVTRVNPRIVRAAQGAIEAPRTEEKFALRLQGRGPGALPRLSNYVDPEHDGEQLLLAEEPDGTVAPGTLRQLLLASSAFPVAFPPQPLAHCVATSGRGTRPACPRESAEIALFLDGGLFDNQPLRLAAALASAGLRDEPSGGSRWLPAPELDRAALPGNVTFVFVSPDAVAYPGERRERPVGSESPLVDLLGQVAGGFVQTARSKELYVLLEERPQIARQIAAPMRHFPAASEPLAAFLGFFETEFRVFDFTLGMYEARRLTVERLAPGAGPGGRPLVFPEETARGPAEPGWRPLRCMRGVFDGEGDALRSCQGEDLRDFRILLQASLERLWDSCSPQPGAGEPGGAAGAAAGEHGLCRAARAGAAVPSVPEVAPVAELRRRAGEREVEQVARLLAAHGFRWRDLGLEPAQARDALQVIRRELGELGERLAQSQPRGQQALVGEAARIAANALLYLPPRAAAWAAAGGALELGAALGLAGGPGGPGPLRLHAALEVRGLLAFASSEPSAFAVAPLGGVDLVVPGLSTPWLQWELLLRGGYLFAERDRWGAGGCSDTEASRIGACSRAVLQAVAAAIVLERVRFHLVGEVYPPLRPGLKTLWSISPAVGAQIRF